MLLLLRTSAFLFGLVAGLSAPVQAQDLPIAMADALKQSGIPATAVGLVVQEVAGGGILAELNAALAFSPASTMKLVTTQAALSILGPDFTWKTSVYASGARTGEVLRGNLIIKGSGDPKLVTENFWLLLRQIRAAGIREIDGDVLLDRSAFEEETYDPATFDGDPTKPYNAGADALLLNYGAFRFRFFPDEAAHRVRVVMDPPAAGYHVVGPRLVRQDECGDWQSKLHLEFEGDRARFRGSFSALCGEKTWYVHPHPMTHTHYFAAVFRQMWRDVGGVFKGEVNNGATPPGARWVTEWESVALPEVIRDVNKYSNNVMARQLLLTLAQHDWPGPAQAARGVQSIKTWLAQQDIAAPELVIENGSGLSRHERISPRTMAHLLVAAFKSPWMPEWVASLPLVGQDGTMRHRLKEHGVAGRAHIKSGSLDDVRAVAGYVLARSGKYYAVVCFINHRNAARGQSAQDALLQWVYEHG